MVLFARDTTIPSEGYGYYYHWRELLLLLVMDTTIVNSLPRVQVLYIKMCGRSDDNSHIMIHVDTISKIGLTLLKNIGLWCDY